MKIAICGGGNMAHALAGMLSLKKNADIYLLTRNPALWSKKLTVDLEGNVFETNHFQVTDKPETAIKNAQIVFLCLPSFARQEVIAKILPFTDNRTWIGSFPGMGNFDLIVNKQYEKNVTKPQIFASQRVPYICRIQEYGKKVNITSKKTEIFVSAFTTQNTPEICNILQPLLDMKVSPLNNFLEITLSTSNPLLHPARTYSMFKNYRQGMYWDHNILFYETWTDEASEILIEMDNEVHSIINEIPFNLSGIKPLLEHYEVKSPVELTKKIRNIKAFKGITSPMKQQNEGWIPDFESRYFTEDITYGLLIIKSVAEIMDVEVKTIDKVLHWAQQHMNQKFLAGNQIDYSLTPHILLHKHFGIDTPEKFIQYYQTK